MKNYNISTQKKSIQAYKKEYLNYLGNAIDSLYTYLHYYNPEWRLLEDGSGYYTKTDPNVLINKTSLEDELYPTQLILTTYGIDEIFISSIIIKKSNTIIQTIEFKLGGNYSNFITTDNILSNPQDEFVEFKPDDDELYYGYVTVSIPKCDEIIIYTTRGNQIERWQSGWGYYYVKNNFSCHLNIIDKTKYNICPNWVYPYDSHIDPPSEQDSYDKQFTFSISVPIKNILYINKLQYRWGYKNTSDHVFWYGFNYNSSLNIGATIYKKDAYDVPSVLRTSDLDHYILFEASLAQYVTWTFSTGVDENNNPALIYNYHISNELDFGLVYNIQTITSTPRYFYKEDASTTYDIKYEDSVFDRMTLFDYININVQYKDNEQWVPSHSGTDYQCWSGATELFPQTVYEVNSQYEDLIAETELYERPGNISTYQVRLEKSKDDQKNIEKSFKVIFS